MQLVFSEVLSYAVTCIMSSRWLSRATISDCRAQPPVMMIVPQKELLEDSHSWNCSSFRIISTAEHYKTRKKEEEAGVRASKDGTTVTHIRISISSIHIRIHIRIYSVYQIDATFVHNLYCSRPTCCPVLHVSGLRHNWIHSIHVYSDSQQHTYSIHILQYMPVCVDCSLRLTLTCMVSNSRGWLGKNRGLPPSCLDLFTAKPAALSGPTISPVPCTRATLITSPDCPMEQQMNRRRRPLTARALNVIVAELTQ